MITFRDYAHYAELDEADAAAMQARLASQVELEWCGGEVRTIAGADTAFPGGGDGVGREMYAAIVVLDAQTLEEIEVATAVGTVELEYLSGFLSFREVPLLAEAWAKLATPVDVLMVDGYGVLHPRRFGLACHTGLLFDVPCMGVAKNRYVGHYPEPGQKRGDVAEIDVSGQVLGRSVRTRSGIKPVYVSAGHRLNLEVATRVALDTSPEYRVPEPTRQADLVVNAMKRGELV